MKELIVRNFPLLGKMKRWLHAVYGTYNTAKLSYSQHQEDQFLYEILKVYDLSAGIYIDVGANHPISISNSILFYKHGYHGVIVEPNSELADLFRAFRSRDIVANVGCGKDAGFLKFHFANAPVISSFKLSSIDQLTNKSGRAVRCSSYLPVLPLDTILENVSYEWAFFLSIDVEGLDFEVLLGAKNTLKRVLFLVIEQNGINEKNAITKLAEQSGFKYITEKGCNLVFQNTDKFFDKYLKIADRQRLNL
jgi:FkbM family methyltransferase